MDQFNHLSPHGDNDEDDEVASAPPAETKPDADNLTLLPNPIRVSRGIWRRVQMSGSIFCTAGFTCTDHGNGWKPTRKLHTLVKRKKKQKM